MARDIEDLANINHRASQLKSTHGVSSPTYESFISSNVNGYDKVLDFGSANHSDATSNLGEKSAHHSVCANNKSVIAVDIVEHGVNRFPNSVYKTLNLLELNKEQQLEKVGRVDAIFAGNIIEHLSNPGLLLELASNLLGAGDKLILTTVNPVWFIGIWDRLFSTYYSNCIDHTVILGAPEFLELAERYGFTLDEWNFIGKMDMMSRFGMGGPFIGRLSNLIYRLVRTLDFSPAYNMLGCVLTKK
jgi:hypothetical protein